MWILRQLFAPEWEEFQAAMEIAGNGYGCWSIDWEMSYGVAVQVAHNYRSHALLFFLGIHPKESGSSYYHFGAGGLTVFSEVDRRSATIHSCGVPLDGRLTSVGLEICDAIHTLGPRLDGQPEVGLRVDLHARDRIKRFAPINGSAAGRR
ncbi:hypothetical protein [Roseateles amylovorans]|uniref:Uncharacterized protein n=1 Tax=Roseateles amylovorans TaxID=2978473 RepID=A0ABY6B1S7_9BURK|nr:hypothetical protein [Roseateles amylovorans]UXH78872.1 hypothetical protein N4261_02715 [Roseateles amylovorans]